MLFVNLMSMEVVAINPMSYDYFLLLLLVAWTAIVLAAIVLACNFFPSEKIKQVEYINLY